MRHKEWGYLRKLIAGADKDTLGKWWVALNYQQWPPDLEKPLGWDRMEPADRHRITRPVWQMVDARLTEDENLYYWQTIYMGKTPAEFREWYRAEYGQEPDLRAVVQEAAEGFRDKLNRDLWATAETKAPAGGENGLSLGEVLGIVQRMEDKRPVFYYVTSPHIPPAERENAQGETEPAFYAMDPSYLPQRLRADWPPAPLILVPESDQDYFLDVVGSFGGKAIKWERGAKNGQ